LLRFGLKPRGLRMSWLTVGIPTSSFVGSGDQPDGERKNKNRTREPLLASELAED
jgi:hypothetical protein